MKEFGLREKYLHWTFEIGVILKGIDGALEVLGGGLLLALSPSRITHLFLALTRPELAEDPNDKIAHLLLHALHGLTAYSRHFLAAYLLSHGVVKIVLVVELLRRRLWAYPASIAVFTLFIVYQLYHLSHVYSTGMVVLTVLDVGVVLLTWHEYRYVQKQPGILRELHKG
ncbi:MAG TPA: DUF2127 domain-containing protein [Thermoanaerobaculia bacterium]